VRVETAARAGFTAMGFWHTDIAEIIRKYSFQEMKHILDDNGISRLRTTIVAGGANNQLARAEHGAKLAERGILYTPDYVINGGGIIAVTLEYLARRDGKPCDVAEVHASVDAIPSRLKAIWSEADETGRTPDVVADEMAQRLIGR